MKRAGALVPCIGAAVMALSSAQAASTNKGHPRHGDRQRVVFVQTNELDGNHIVVFNRGRNGQLRRAGTYATGGNGGIATPGTEPDRLASQGSLVYDREHKLLIAVNAGSDTVSTFKVQGDRLRLTGVVPSGGGFPASIAVHDDLVYVLNSGGPGIVQGFEIRGHRLRELSDSARSLGLANTDPPDFLTSPGQVGFTPDGSKLIVTTKASGSHIDVFNVRPNGRLSQAPVMNPSATPVPFAFTFHSRTGRLVVGEAGMSSVTTYLINADRTLADPRSQTDGQMALCWIVRTRGFFYVTNTGSNNVSGFRIGADGQPALIGGSPVLATTAMGPIDMTVSGRFLYVQTGGAGTIDQFRIKSDGTLTPRGSVTGLPVGQEGIASA
jgi:6-phosphogluconolactonase (cycloisomerase 2 family)